MKSKILFGLKLFSLTGFLQCTIDNVCVSINDHRDHQNNQLQWLSANIQSKNCTTDNLGTILSSGTPIDSRQNKGVLISLIGNINKNWVYQNFNCFFLYIGQLK